MLTWQGLWTIVWFGGLGVFVLASIVVTIRGGLDLRSLMRDLRNMPPHDAAERDQG